MWLESMKSHNRPEITCEKEQMRQKHRENIEKFPTNYFVCIYDETENGIGFKRFHETSAHDTNDMYSIHILSPIPLRNVHTANV